MNFNQDITDTVHHRLGKTIATSITTFSLPLAGMANATDVATSPWDSDDDIGQLLSLTRAHRAV